MQSLSFRLQPLLRDAFLRHVSLAIAPIFACPGHSVHPKQSVGQLDLICETLSSLGTGGGHVLFLFSSVVA